MNVNRFKDLDCHLIVTHLHKVHKVTVKITESILTFTKHLNMGQFSQSSRLTDIVTFEREIALYLI